MTWLEDEIQRRLPGSIESAAVAEGLVAIATPEDSGSIETPFIASRDNQLGAGLDEVNSWQQLEANAFVQQGQGGKYKF